MLDNIGNTFLISSFLMRLLSQFKGIKLGSLEGEVTKAVYPLIYNNLNKSEKKFLGNVLHKYFNLTNREVKIVFNNIKPENLEKNDNESILKDNPQYKNSNFEKFSLKDRKIEVFTDLKSSNFFKNSEKQPLKKSIVEEFNKISNDKSENFSGEKANIPLREKPLEIIRIHYSFDKILGENNFKDRFLDKKINKYSIDEQHIDKEDVKINKNFYRKTTSNFKDFNRNINDLFIKKIFFNFNFLKNQDITFFKFLISLTLPFVNQHWKEEKIKKYIYQEEKIKKVKRKESIEDKEKNKK